MRVVKKYNARELPMSLTNKAVKREETGHI